MPPPSWPGLARAPECRLPYPLETEGVRLFARARQALSLCLPQLGLQPGDEALVPTYHHGSEVEALLRAGLRCRFYDPADDLQPDEAVLDRLITPRTRVLHLIHHLGFPQDAARWRRWCDDRGLLLVEDAAQSWLAHRDGDPVGSSADLAIFCLYKSVGVPDGAAVIGRTALPNPEAQGGGGIALLAKPLAQRVLRRHGRPAGDYDHYRDIALPTPSRGPSVATRLLLRRFAPGTAAARRRANYRQLQDELEHLLPAPFAELPEGASPWTFPIAVAAKDAALAVLARSGVNGVDLWRYPHPALQEDRAYVASYYRAHVVGLPVHQELTADDLLQVVSAAIRLRSVGQLTP